MRVYLSSRILLDADGKLPRTPTWVRRIDHTETPVNRVLTAKPVLFSSGMLA